MTVFYVLLCIFGLVILLSTLSSWLTRVSRKNTSDKWEVGDFVKLSYLSLITDSTKLCKLVGWNSDFIFVQENNITYKVKWGHLEYNKSANWRENYMSCKKYMKDKEPDFSQKVVPLDEDKNQIEIDGKPIELLTETECEVFLKRAIEDENFEIADAIRKRLENFK